MAVHLGTSGARAERIRAAAAAKDRNRRIALGLLAGVFVIILAVELPSTLNKLSGSGGSTPAAAQPAAVPQAATLDHPSLGPALKQLQKLASKDPFVPQVGSTSSGSAVSGASPATPAGPAVRTKDFVAKDPFVPQIAIQSATPVSTPKATSTTPATTAPAPSSTAVGGYVVVLSSLPAAHGQKVAGLAVIAAENAGLVDVKSSTLPTTGSALDVYTGPYPSQAVAQQELIRALRDGFTQATVANLPHSQHTQ